jgi:DNA-binding transcriptional MerR regulator
VPSRSEIVAGDPRIPDKQYFRIGEVAEIAGVEAYVLRFWESEFPGLAPAKSQTNRRTYSRKDVSLVLRIRDLLYEEGYTIAGARRQLARGGPERPETPERTRAVLRQIRNEVEELLRLVQE